MNINITKLLENFVDIKNIANFRVLRCLMKLFSKKDSFVQHEKGILSRIMIIFYDKQQEKLDDKIKDIKFGINNWDLVKEDERKKREKIGRAHV